MPSVVLSSQNAVLEVSGVMGQIVAWMAVLNE